MKNVLFVIFAVVLVILCAVMIVLAAKSMSGREARMKDFYRKANRQKELYKKYKDMSSSQMKDEPAKDVIEALAVAVQTELDDELSANEAFLNLEKWRRYAYAAYYFFEDSGENLSVFFRKNGEPLVSAAVECICASADEDTASVVKKEYEMLDDNNESISLDKEKLAEWDSLYAQTDREVLYEKVKLLILEMKDSCGK